MGVGVTGVVQGVSVLFSFRIFGEVGVLRKDRERRAGIGVSLRRF